MSRDSADLKIVVIGGGTGSSTILGGLKNHTNDVTAVVTMFDSGGSSGLLETEFGYPPLGDLRQCLLSLSENNETNHSMRELLDFRFQKQSSLNGHSLGNLLLAALTTIGEDLEVAIDEMARLLQIQGRVIPVSLERAELCAELVDGYVVRGESNIDLRRQPDPKIKRVYLDLPVHANLKAEKAILSADVVVLGPGDLYTSIIPNLLAEGICEALAETQATRIYICNLMTKMGETDHFKGSDFVREIIRYLGSPSLDWVLINNGDTPKKVLENYLNEGSYPVEPDVGKVGRYVSGVFAACLGNSQVPLQHEPSRVAEVVFEIASLGRTSEIVTSNNGHPNPILVTDHSVSLGHPLG